MPYRRKTIPSCQTSKLANIYEKMAKNVGGKSRRRRGKYYKKAKKGRLVDKQRDGWLRREMGSYVGRRVLLNREMGG
jgi:hypothetical protein